MLILVLCFTAACQKEEFEVLTEDDQNAITTGSQVYDVVLRTTMHDGSEDDEIDESPCFSIEFPYSISLSGQEITISSAAQRASFLNQVGQTAFSLNFPLTIRNAAHQQITVMNRQQFAGLQQSCRTAVAMNEAPITCAQLELPVLLFAYDRALQQTSSSRFSNKEDLFTFLNNLDANTVVSFEYPLIVVRGNARVEIRNNAQLFNSLRSCQN